MRLKLLNLFHRIVVVDAQAHVVTGGDEPLLAGDEFGTADGKFGEFEGFDAGACFVVPDYDVSAVECGEGPWFGGVDVD